MFKTMSTLIIGIILSTTLITTAAPAAGAKRSLLGSYKSWDAMVSGSGKNKECYMISTPRKSTASRKGATRGDIYTTVTHRPSFGIKNEVNAIVGYPLRANSEVSVTMDGKSKYKLFTEGRGAWAYSPKDDAKMIASMKRGSTMRVSGTSGRGTRTTDTYSLSGFTAAYNAISKACR